ncbi:MAG TPA: DUF655 domain-containing protein [Candidimonas sp.]|nr:DUF655 domain-containing protein [Candidimonas sp.]
MNPFTESTVARPLSPRSSLPVPGASSIDCQKKRRSLLKLTLGAVGLASSLGGPPVAGLQAAGALLAGTGMVVAAVVPAAAYAVDVNSATQEQLQGVRGIGPKTAQVIIEERTRGGRYESFEDLSDRVKGIGPKKSATLQASGLTVGGQGAGATSGLVLRDSARADKTPGAAGTGVSARAAKKSP